MLDLLDLPMYDRRNGVRWKVERRKMSVGMRAIGGLFGGGRLPAKSRVGVLPGFRPTVLCTRKTTLISNCKSRTQGRQSGP